MLEAARVRASFIADTDEFERGVARAKGAVDDFARDTERHTQRAGQGFDALGHKASGLAGTLSKGLFSGAGFAAGLAGFQGIQSAIGGVTDAVFGFNSRMQQADIAFTTMLGSADKARGMLGDLQRFAAATPFEFPELVTASQKMLAFGFSSERVIPMLRSIGDAVAGLGGGSEAVQRVTNALGQMQAKGKVSAEEMLQLTEAGIPAWDMLARKIGVSIPEAMKLSEKGAIDATTAITAITEGMNERFGGMMEKQSRTWGGLVSTLKDNFTILTATALRPLFDTASEGLARVTDVVGSPGFQQGAERFGRFLADGIAGLVRIGSEVGPPAVAIFREGFTAIGVVIDRVGPPVRSFLSFTVEHFGTIAPVIGVAVAAFATLSTVVGVVTSVTGAITAMGAGITAAGGVVPALVAVMGGPLTLTIGAVALAVAGLALAWKTDFLGMRGHLEDFAGAVVRFLQPPIDTVLSFGREVLPEVQGVIEVWGPRVQGVIGALASFITDRFTVLAGFVRDNWDSISRVIEGAWNVISGMVQVQWAIVSGIILTGLNILQGDWFGAWNSIKDMFSGVWEGIERILRGQWQVITGLIETSLSAIWTAMQAGGRRAADAFLSPFRGLGGLLSGAINVAVGVLNKFIGGINAILDKLRMCGMDGWHGRAAAPRRSPR